MLYGGDTYRVGENEIVILKGTEKAMMRAMCGIKLIEKRSCQELADLLSLEETWDRLAKAKGMQSCCRVLRGLVMML